MKNAKYFKRDLQEIHHLLTRTILLLDRNFFEETVRDILKIKTGLPIVREEKTRRVETRQEVSG